MKVPKEGEFGVRIPRTLSGPKLSSVLHHILDDVVQVEVGLDVRAAKSSS